MLSSALALAAVKIVTGIVVLIACVGVRWDNSLPACAKKGIVFNRAGLCRRYRFFELGWRYITVAVCLFTLAYTPESPPGVLCFISMALGLIACNYTSDVMARSDIAAHDVVGIQKSAIAFWCIASVVSAIYTGMDADRHLVPALVVSVVYIGVAVAGLRLLAQIESERRANGTPSPLLLETT